MTIRKVKLSDTNRITIVFEQISQNGNDTDEFRLSSKDRARPEFYAALHALRKHVIEMCELPVEYEDRITVRGVSISIAGEMDVRGATITAQMELSNAHAPLNLNTPHKTEDMHSPGVPQDPLQLLSQDCLDALWDLCEEAERYVKGERAQQTLHLE